RDSPAGDVYFAVWGMNGSEVTPMTVPLPPGIPPVGEGVGAESQSAMLVEGRTSAGVNYTTRFYVGEDIRLIDGPNDLVSPTDVTARLETFDAQLIGPPYDLGKWVAAFENPLVNGGLGQSFAFRGERVTITEVYQDLSETRVRLEGGTDLSFNTASPPSSVEGSIATYRNVQAQITGIAQDKTVISVDGLSTLELAVGDHAVIPGHADAHIKVTGINPVAGTVDVKWEYTNWLLTDRQPGQPGMDQSTVEDLNGIVNTLVTKVNCTPTGELQSLELVLNDMTQRILYGDRPNQKLFTNRESPFFNIDFAGMTGLGGSQVRGVELKTDQSTAPTYSFLILSYTDPITGMQVGDVDGQTSPLPPLRILEKISSTLRKLLIRNQEIPGTYNISPNNLIMTTKADTSGKEYTLAWEYLGVDVGRSVAQFRDKADAGTVYEFPVSPSGDFTLARSTPTGQLSIDGKVQDVMSSVSTIAVDMNGNGVHNPADTGVVYSIFRFPGGYGLKVPPSIQPDGISLTPGDGSHQVYFIIPADKRVRDPSVPSSPLEINFQFSAGGDPDARVPYAIPIIPISGFDESLRQFRPDLNRLVTIYPGMRVVYFEGGLGQTKLNFYPDVFRNVADLKFARRREP
ncbi:hypothetical protein J4410_02820, partial [Candidatus Woesearchaeota archaeon]|nr:hypothetical protein [Candidatus Woesearchaeota archaeon]